ncbi:MAG: hypothetical protein QM644_21565 [Mobilitalea sp.]
MPWIVLCLSSILLFLPTTKDQVKLFAYSNMSENTTIATENVLTNMEALDLVKELYANNFEKVEISDSPGEYFFRLPFADYYLYYEGEGATADEYMFHLYEFVVDDPETSIGHTVTYGWYTVNKITHEIKDQTVE